MKASACLQCRRARRRCMHSDNAADCVRCTRKGLTCTGKVVHDKPESQVQNVGGLVESIKTSSKIARDLSLFTGTAIELVDLYLDKFDCKPHSIFHPPSLRAQARNGTLGRTLFYAISAISCKFSGNLAVRERGSEFAAQAHRLLQADITTLSLENVQACILVATRSVGHGDTAGEALFFRIALTMAELMHFDRPSSTLAAVDQELRRRIWWSLYNTDIWCISGQGLQSQMQHISPRTNAPMSDHAFQSLSRGSGINLINHTESTGVWGQTTTLIPLFVPIHALNQQIAEDVIPDTDVLEQVEQLSVTLQQWQDELPPEAQFNQQNLDQQQRARFGGLLISLHLTYHHFATLLFFHSLEHPEPVSSTPDRAIKCKHHAATFSALLRQSRQLKDCDVVYPNLGHMITVSSAVHVHTLLFGAADGDLEQARYDLNSNFEALVDLQRYWPAASSMIKRLVAFQDMCLATTQSNADKVVANKDAVGDPPTHQVDRWMVRFLIEHSLHIPVVELQERPARRQQQQPQAQEVSSARRPCSLTGPRSLQSRKDELSAQRRYTAFCFT